MTKKILSFYSAIESIVNGLIALIVSIFLATVTQLAPLAAPIPPAFSVYMAMRFGLAVPEYVAIIAAISIEVTGIFSARTAIRVRHWNAIRLKSDPEAPLGLSVFMAMVFFVVVLILSFTIELWPELAVWVYPGFVLVSATVYVNMAIAMNLNAWEKAKDAAKNERLGVAKDKRLLADQKTAIAVERPIETANSRPIAGQEMTVASRRLEVGQLKAAGKSRQEMANELNVSLGTIKNDLRIISNGKVK